ncbi:acetylcholinesterase-1 [Galendromus occidentalis]|uniref:Carboxylic ester hydrolase n=1 Tax=Galendromus occidentalis TaxID=34638 RepID=A0AAJ6VY54_9ACAR|nr:acetylcholinesterase-1 [Galendromus occidentalis]
MSLKTSLITLGFVVSFASFIDARCYILMPQEFYEGQRNLTETSVNSHKTETVIHLPKNHSQIRIVVDDGDEVSDRDEAARSGVELELSEKAKLNDEAATTSSSTPLNSSEISSKTEGPVVELNSGKIEGIPATQGTVHKFFGIPFAEAPLGELRFRHPVTVKSWSPKTVRANTKPFPCLQGPFYINSNLTIDTANSTEDCLYLNVWTPDDCVLNGTCGAQKSVMVFIYGGTYTFGSSGWNMYDGEQLALRGDVVVVSFNYRVGPFGFLYSATEDAPGNAGLFDQLMALKWVQDNIRLFGGNPNDVTLFGQSAGAISIAYHMASPLTRGLFHKVIMQSGSSYFRMTDPTREGPKKVEKLANSMECLQDGELIETHAKEIVACLRKKDGKELMETTFSAFGLNALTFFPIHGDEFLPKPAQELITSGKLPKVPVLIGNNKDEGSYFIYYLFGRSLSLADLDLVTKYEIDLYVTFGLQMLLQSNVRNIRAQYFDGVKEEETMKALRQAAIMVGDLAMVCPTKYFAEEAAAQNLTVHYYEFDFRSSFGTWPDWVGTTHGEEIPFVFGHPLSGLEANATAEDKEMSREMIKIWTDFAKTGLTPVKLRGTPWPAYTEKSQTYLRIGQTSTGIGRGPNERMCNSWRKYLIT